MDPRLRYAPVGALVLAIAIRLFKPDFLSFSPFQDERVAWISWWGIVLPILLYTSAWILTPHVVHGFNRIARYHMLPPVLVFGAFIVGLWALDTFWNSTVLHFNPDLPRSHMLPSLTAAITGASP